MMTAHPLHAGDGYTYLTREVATGDYRLEKGEQISDYYNVDGNPPGIWGGSGAEVLGVSGTVSEYQMKALFGEGLHPNADEHIRQAIAEGTPAKEAVQAERLGRRFASFRNDVPFMRRVRTDFESERERLGTTLTEEQRTAIRYRIGADQFHIEIGRSPADESELARYMASQTRRERQPVAGYDCVFTPVKSASVLWVLGDDTIRRAVQNCHAEARDLALEQIEEHAAYTRVGKAGVAQIETKGLTYTRFDHRDNRNGDPNLHTHVAISTKVMGVDGKWRSLDGRVLHKLAVSASETYNTAFEQALSRELGVQFVERAKRTAGRRPVREIDGISQELIDEFSRRETIEKRLTELVASYRNSHGRNPSPAMQTKLADQATLETRGHKPAPRSYEAMRRESLGRAARVLGTHRVGRVVRRCIGRKVSTVTADQIDAHEAGAAVLSVLEREKSSWNRWHVAAEVDRQLKDTIFATDADYLTVRDKVTESVLGRGSIRLTRKQDSAPAVLRRSDGESVLTVHGNQTYTSRGVLESEARLVAAAHTPTAVMGSEEAFNAALAASQRLKGRTLNAGQEALARHFVFSGTLLSAGIGPAGTGKTTAMKVVTDAWKAGGANVHALASSQVAAKVLEAEIDATGQTIDRVLTLHQHGHDTGIRPGDLILVDEAGMASRHNIDRIVAVAYEQGAVVKLLGDPQQLGAVEGGGALRLVAKETNAPTLSAVHRFADHEEREISLRLRAGDQSAAAWYFAKDRVHYGMEDELVDRVYSAWKADTDAGKDSVMAAPRNDTVAQLNERARSDRIAAGEVDPADQVALADDLHAGIGDRIVTRQNDTTLRAVGSRNDWVANGDLWDVLEVGGDGSMHVQHINHGGTVVLPPDYVRHWCELGYATTVHRVQGATVDTLYGIADPSMDRQSLYVMLSRAVESNNAFVVTDKIIDLDLDHKHPEERIADEVLRGIIGRDGAERSATEQQREAAVEHLKLSHNIPGYGYANDLLDAGRYEAIVREHLGHGLANTMMHEDAWEAFVHQAQRAEAVGLDLGNVLREAAAERELASAESVSEVMHWRLQPRIDTGLHEADVWADHLKPTLRDAFGRHAETILDDQQSWSELAVRLRHIDRTGYPPERAIDDLRETSGAAEPTVRQLIELSEQRWPLGRERRDPAAPTWVQPPHQDREGVDHELVAWSHRRYAEITDRTRELGQQAATERPEWTTHLGEVPDSGIDRARWIAAAAQAAAYREQFGVTTDRSLLGEQPEHGDAARAYHHITARIRDLRGESEPAPAAPADLVERTAMQQKQLHHDQQLAEERAEQRRLEEARRAQRRDEIRRQQPGPHRRGPTL